MNLAALSALLFLLLPCAAIAADSPEDVYGKYHQAFRAGKFEEAKKYASARNGSTIKPVRADQRDGLIALIKAILPQSYDVWGNDPGADGKSVTLRATGRGSSLSPQKPGSVSGVILLQKEGDSWKVEKADWQGAERHGLTPEDISKTPATTVLLPVSPPKKPPPVTVAAPAPPAAPDRVIGAAKEPCVYKPVMTSEDMERCR